MKLHLGCGLNRLDGWENCDREVDLTRALPFESGAAELIFAEHVIEHVPFRAALLFLRECERVLAPGGHARLAFPDAHRVSCLSPADLQTYIDAVQSQLPWAGDMRGVPVVTLEDALRLVFEGWGHESAWTEQLGLCALVAAGFASPRVCGYGESRIPALRGVEMHGLRMSAAPLETSVVEGTKRGPSL